MTTDERIWLIWSNEHLAWWRPNRAGYTNDIDQAGRYTEAEKDDICPGHPRAGGTLQSLHPGVPDEMGMLDPTLATRLREQAAELERARGYLLAINDTMRATSDNWIHSVACDCIDNDGEPYQSADLAKLLAALSGEG